MINLIRYNNLARFEEIEHFTTTRQGGISTDTYASLNVGLFTNDNAKNIRSNQLLLCKEIGIDINQLICAHQTHKTNTCIIDNNFLASSPEKKKFLLEDTDALITNIKEICISIATADCVPVLLFDSKKKAIAAIHSGWRGTLNNISEQCIRTMRQSYASEPADLTAAIGPSISQPYYEVGKELFDLFAEKNELYITFFKKKNKEKYLLDVKGIVKTQLLKIGIKDIEVSPYCTFAENNRFFSARKLGIQSGRIVSGIYLK